MTLKSVCSSHRSPRLDQPVKSHLSKKKNSNENRKAL